MKTKLNISVTNFKKLAKSILSLKEKLSSLIKLIGNAIVKTFTQCEIYKLGFIQSRKKRLIVFYNEYDDT